MKRIELMTTGLKAGLLVTLLTTAGVLGCGEEIQCAKGTKLSVDKDGNKTCVPDGNAVPCDAPSMIVDGVCVEPAPETCEMKADYCATQAEAWKDTTTSIEVKVFGPNNCSCEATACKENYNLYNGRCVNAGVDCIELLGCGFRNEGGTCVALEDISCADCADSPICIQVRCEEYPNLRGQTSPGGRPLCIDDPPPPAESCENCHGKLAEAGGIEDPHPWFGGPDLTCTGCHGGDATATTRTDAHVKLPTEWQATQFNEIRPGVRYYYNYLTLFGVENFTGGLDWLRFRNPSDLRVASLSCGKNSGCHQDRVENVRLSVMATEVGLTGGALSRDGVARSISRGTGGIYKWDVTEGMTLGEPELTAKAYSSEFVGSMQKLNEFKIVNRETNGAYSHIDVLKEVYDKQCGDCHLGNAGANNRYADFRSSGCGSCHMTYRLDGRSESADPFMSTKNEPTYPQAWAQIAAFNVNDFQDPNYLGPERPHPRTHRLTKTMSSQRCGTCHVGSNRTDWQFRGYRFDPNRDAVLALDNNRLNADQIQFTDEIDNNANADARYHGAAQNQIIKYEDWNNDGLDDTPADVHYVAGLECMDCHTSAEMHNELKFVKVAKVTDWNDPNQVVDMSGAIWSKQDQATEIECVHCHGNLEYRALPYLADNRNPIKNLIACPEPGETIADYPTPAECGRLGSGRWLRSKFTGRFHYVTQTKDTANYVVGVGGASRPNGSPVASLNASIFHGRFDGNNLANGAGPCPNGDVNNCYKDQINQGQQVRPGFSHLGATAQNAVDQHAGGLECYACHSTWVNGCFGCHMTLADNDGNQILRDFSRTTGELGYGQIAQADFSYIDPLAIQLGVNSEGKIAQFLPETKQAIRHIDYQNNDYFGGAQGPTVNNDNNLVYNIYRQRSGYGTRQYDTEQVGLPLNSDGPEYEQDARMDNNAGQGFNQFMPHSVQRSHPMMDCNQCHLDANNNNTDAIEARLGVNDNGFANVSAYLIALNGLQILRNNTNQPVNVNQNVGFRLDANTDPDGFVVDQQTDWVVFDDGFPLSYSNHPIKEGTIGLDTDPFYSRIYPQAARISGPFNQALLNKMLNDVRNNNEGVQFKSVR